MADDLGSDSFRLLFEEHFERLASFTRSLLGSDLEAEDVAQEAFVILHLRRARLRPDVSPRPYLDRVAFRLCLARLRRNARRRTLAMLFGSLAPQEAPAPSNPVDLFFTGLPSRQRAIAHLHFAEDLSPSEIARELGIAPSTVRVQLGRVRKRLRAEVSSPASADRCPNAT
ncbi:MAG: RNA polymerase sigma factor [Thermoanaerobaculia bacterium]